MGAVSVSKSRELPRPTSGVSSIKSYCDFFLTDITSVIDVACYIK